MNCQIILTRNCNFNCTYCYQKEKSNIVMSEKTIEKTCDFIFKKILEDTTTNSSINISGGECLLYPNKIKKLVMSIKDKCKENGIAQPSFELSTNASLLTDDIINFFLNNKISLYIGFDGISISQNLNRVFNMSSEKTFEKCFENLEILNNIYNDISVTINNVISNNNVQWINDNFDFLHNTFPHFTLSYNIAYNSEWDNNSIKTLEFELDNLAKKYIQILKFENINFSIPIFDRQIGLNINEINPTIPRCGAGFTPLGISPEGYIEACTQLTGLDIEEYSIIGNLIQGINNNKVKLFRDSLLEFDKLTTCSECDFNNRCYNFCPSINFLSSGNIYKISTSQCEINKILINISDYIINELETSLPLLLESRFINKTK